VADESIHPDRNAPPGWLQRLREEELSGFAFAFKARAIALGIVFIWVVFSSSWTRLPVLIAAMALFFVVGWIGYATRRSRCMLAIQVVCALADVAIIVLASHYPEHDWYEWALQSWLRRSAFLYLVAYVAASALTFSVKIVLVTGAAAFLGQLASFAFVLHSAEHVDSFRGFTAQGALDLLRQLIEVQGIDDPVVFMANQLVLLAITTGLIAGAIWRARRHVERAVLAETERANLGRYFSPNVVERLASDVRGLEAGRAQNAAVMFVDVIGSTRRMEAITPEEVITIIRAFHRRIVPIVFRHNGSVDKFLGDGLMAVFGAPEKTPYEARDALLCAVEILDSIDQERDQRIAVGKVASTVGIGIHYGPVIQGNVGIADRMEFTTLGDTVNVASRLESMTRQFDAGILLSQETLAAAERSSPLPADLKARCRNLGLQPIVGHTPIHIIAIDRRPAA
jgi:adenylate cyclase